MRQTQRHIPYSKDEFEAALRLSSPFGPFPEEWNWVQWDDDSQGGYVHSQLETPINEYCYIVPIVFDPTYILKVYSSVDRSTNWSRDVGGDAIRIVLADSSGKPKHEAFKRINRIQTWDWNMRLRISEALAFLGFNMKCPKCGKPLFLRWRRETGKRFLGCSEWPNCEGSRNYASLNIAPSSNEKAL